MFKIDPDYYYTVTELEKNKICSRTTLYRKIKSGAVRAGKSINGETVVKGDELIKHIKTHPVAS